MTQPTQSHAAFKNAARLLQQHIADHGSPASHPAALDALSAAHGVPDWNTMSAILKATDRQQARAARSQQGQGQGQVRAPELETAPAAESTPPRLLPSASPVSPGRLSPSPSPSPSLHPFEGTLAVPSLHAFLSWMRDSGNRYVVANPGSAIIGYEADRHGAVAPAVRGPEMSQLLRTMWGDRAEARVHAGGTLEFVYKSVASIRARDQIRVRCKASREPAGISLHIELLPSDLPKAEDLEIEPEIILGGGLRSRDSRGELNLICSPGGAGKSSTLYALLRYAAQRTGSTGIREHVYDFGDGTFPAETLQSSHVVVHGAEFDPHLSLQDRADRLRTVPRSQTGCLVNVGDLSGPVLEESLVLASRGHSVFAEMRAGDVPNACGFLAYYDPDGSRRIAGLLNMVVAQIMVPTEQGGRVAVREFLILDDAMRADFAATPWTRWTALAETLVTRSGRTLTQSAERLLQAGRISRQTVDNNARAIRGPVRIPRSQPAPPDAAADVPA